MTPRPKSFKDRITGFLDRTKKAARGSRAGMNKKTDQSQDWITPPWLVGVVERLAGGMIDLDPCASAARKPSAPGTENPVGARVFLTAEENGLRQPWGENLDPTIRTVYVNPPYKRQQEWVEKVIEETEKSERRLSIWLLGPSFTDQPWYGLALSWATSEWHVRGRVRFLRPGGGQTSSPRFPTVLFGFGPSIVPPSPYPGTSRPELREGTWILRGIITKPLDTRRAPR